jgi:hypothetical protein
METTSANLPESQPMKSRFEKIRFKDIQVGDLIYFEYRIDYSCDWYKQGEILKRLTYCVKKSRITFASGRESGRTHFLTCTFKDRKSILKGSLMAQDAKFYRMIMNDGDSL